MKRRRSKNDCLRQCVARATDRPPHTVPHFVGIHRGRWLDALSRWCDRVGYELILVVKPRGMRSLKLTIHAERWINLGITRRGTGHAVYVGPRGIEYDGGNPLRTVHRVLFLIPKAKEPKRG